MISMGAYNADNQLTLWGSQGFLYDLNGNMTADGQNAFSWNVRNQLVALTPDGGTANTFVYDAFGRRQKKVINGTETDFLFDQNGNLAAELTDGGEYFTATDLSGVGADELVCRYTAGADGGLNQPLMAMTDINGSVIGLVADGGVLQATYAYEPYGATQASGTDDGNSQQYAGRENDGTGIYYYRSRYYMPSTGRFISEDPTGFGGGTNVYAYANMDPVLGFDPSGAARCTKGCVCYIGTPGCDGAATNCSINTAICSCVFTTPDGNCYTAQYNVLAEGGDSSPLSQGCNAYCNGIAEHLPKNPSPTNCKDANLKPKTCQNPWQNFPGLPQWNNSSNCQ
jgi:RHS repeat-associated protein